MKKPFSHRRSKNGMTLLIVLGIVALLAILVVSFLLKTNTETASAANYSAVNSAQQLADTAINLVQAQINEAVTQGDGTIWASQPGAIRVFNKDGSLRNIHRLYSAAALKSNTAADLNSDIPPANWAERPSVWVDLNAPMKSKDASNAETLSYPILDPRGSAASIEGFSWDNAPGATSDQPVPMPVRWIYMLKNGELVPPAESGGVVNISGASKDNPIVGRIAYWTDDETSKVNINTASIGSFWDVPRFDFADDMALATYQPAGREYQRYPGHPATTTLAKVLPMLSTEQIYSMTSRYNEGGSKGGTAIASGVVPEKSERLYPSVGELMLTPERNGQGLSRQQVDSAQFFLTARSRAPEINLFGQPRISIWPIHQTDSATYRSANDRLMAFASSAAGNPYYFSRIDPRSPTTDISLGRNNELLGYLDRLTSSEIPGFGGTFSGKYGSDNRQILTEIFDYVRTTNLRDSSGSSAFRPYADPNVSTTTEPGEGQVAPSYHAGWDTMGFGRFYKVIEASVVFVGVGEGNNTTVTPPTTAIPVDARQGASMAPAYPGTPPTNHRAVQALFVLNFFDPALGWSALGHDFTVQIDGLQQFELAGQAMGMPSTGSMWLGGVAASSYARYPRMNGGRSFGGLMDFRVMLGTRRLGNSDPATHFPFYSKIVDVPLQPPAPLSPDTMSFGGGQVTVSLFYGNSAVPGALVQTYTIAFPSVVLPVPRVSDFRVMGTTSEIKVSGPEDRFDNVTGSTSRRRMLDTTGSEATSKDVVLSMICNAQAGDYRMLAKRSVPGTSFQLHPDSGANRRLAHGFVQGDGNKFTGNGMGTLVSGVAYAQNRYPVAPASVTSAVTASGAPGDWDTGLPHTPDGPYINKPDEGNILNLSTATPYYNTPQSNEPVGATFFSPNRQAVSPVMFGSLSSGVKAQKPWQTLLFRPGPGNHPGEKNQPVSGAPPDHLLLDLFWMPTVEPYAISEPFSTAGKVNLNYQIAPFSYITRNTALRSVLANVKTAKVSKSQPRVEATTTPPGYPGSARVPLNLSDANGTLRQFREKFANGDLFRSASEICDIYLVPQGDAWASDAAARTAWYGDAFAMVGDNVRERPYAEIYPRVTTQSNTFTIHYEVQALKNPPSANQGQWNEATGKVVGEYRGSAMVERYIDPNDPKLLTNDYDFANNSNALSLETLYRWRTVENRQFAP